MYTVMECLEIKYVLTKEKVNNLHIDASIRIYGSLKAHRDPIVVVWGLVDI